ncbi:MAG: RHS repeat-associated core domain-containing protein, partial [Phycisphaerae bacterium]|nr:RHS repeat-associated core domain-containing protein [Phycisphaerae bacterium]
YVVDAWNRVVRVEWLRTPLPTPIYDTLEYSYNGLNHLVLETRTPADAAAPTKLHRFYSPTWQLLLERHETFDGTTWQPGAIERQFFGLRGLDDAILRRVDANADGDFADQGDLSYHQLTDASFSVIAHVDYSTGLLRESMSYDAFGAMKVLRPGDFDGDGLVDQAHDWDGFNDAFLDPALAPLHCDVDLDGIITGSDYDLFAQLWEDSLDSEANPPDEVRLGYAGYVRDPTTGLLLARHRWYDAGVGRWITRDPAGYVDGLSLYLYAKGNPFALVDPMGLSGDEPAEAVDYTIIGERTVEVTTTTSSRSWAGAIAESLTLGLYKADRNATSTTQSFEWDQSMPSNGMLAGEFIRAAQTGDLPHGVSAEQVEWVEAERKMVAEGLEQVKRGAQDVVISAASAPLFAAAAKAKKATMDDAAGATVPAGGKKKPHGNTAGDQPADLYKKYDKDGNFLKDGVSQDAQKRYTKKKLAGGKVKVIERGPRREMLRKERERVETNPGPENHEPWAGKKRPKE